MNGKQRLQSLLIFNSLSCTPCLILFFLPGIAHAAIFHPFQECVRVLCDAIAHKVVIILFCQRSSVYSYLNASLFHIWPGEVITLGVPISHTSEVNPCITLFGTMKYRWRYFTPTLCMRRGCIRRPSCHVQLNYDAKPSPGADLSKSSAVKSGGCWAVWGNCFGSCFIFNSKAQAIGLNYSNRHLAVHNILHLFSHAVYSV